MSFKLIIVESPAKCKSIEKYMGKGYKCVASYGHIREMDTKKGLDCIDRTGETPSYFPKFKNVYKQQKHIQSLKTLTSKASDIFLATDDDREGEAIAWHICIVCKLPIKTTKRIIFHEITQKAVQKAVMNPGIINMKKVEAQQCRQVLDLLIGYTISPVLWKQISYTAGLSAGRCQTPALRLVYDNQCEIDNDKQEQIFNIYSFFEETKGLKYDCKPVFTDGDETEDFLMDCAEHDFVSTKTKDKSTKISPPQPFTTSILQQTSSNNLHYSPKQTMQIAQKLYEGGYITYMRTDAKIYSKEFIAQAKPFIKNKYGDEYFAVEERINKLSTHKTQKGKTKKSGDANTQDAHEAIRPTNITEIGSKITEKISPQAYRLYTLIRNRTLETLMSDATQNSYTIKIKAPKERIFTTSLKLVMFDGWKIVNGFQDDREIYELYKTIINKNSLFNLSKIHAEETLTKTSSHYTEAKLVSMLESKGIGRPSTFSSLIDKIQERNYVRKEDVEGKNINCKQLILSMDVDKKTNEIVPSLTETFVDRVIGTEKNKLVLQPIGKMVIEYLLETCGEYFQYDYTSNMEQSLDNIENKNGIMRDICKECDNSLQNHINKLNLKNKNDDNSLNNTEKKRENPNIYKIDDIHSFKIAKYGPVIQLKEPKKKVVFIPLQKKITMEYMKKHNPTFEELSKFIVVKERIFDNLLISNNTEPISVALKKGPYGFYLKYGTENISLDKDIVPKNANIQTINEEIIIERMREYVKEKEDNNNSLSGASKTPTSRKINEEYSIKTGKYGPYIFFKTDKMKKPKFISLKPFIKKYQKEELNVFTCEIDLITDWLEIQNK